MTFEAETSDQSNMKQLSALFLPCATEADLIKDTQMAVRNGREQSFTP